MHVADLGTVLGVWAHPDDEAYLSAGLMAMARAGGQRVVMVTATAGEQGSDDPQLRGSASLSRLRVEELRCSLAELGVAEHHMLGFRDGACDGIPCHVGASRVDDWIAKVRPDTIITFGPDGMTGHPDHIAVHRWTTEAWRRRDAQPRLLYATVTPGFHARWGAVNERIGLWGGAVPCTPADRLALELDCTPVLDRKVAALMSHASQVGPLIDALGVEDYRQWWATESFAFADMATRQQRARPGPS